MHSDCMDLMRQFIDEHLRKLSRGRVRVLDVGARRVRRSHETFRSLFRGRHWEYVGLDITNGRNVDVVVHPSRRWPVELRESFDVVISANCMEHVADLSALARNIVAAMKPGGLACLIVPSVGRVHWGQDYWRILPDGLVWLFRDLEEIDCRIFNRDTVGIFRKAGEG